MRKPITRRELLRTGIALCVATHLTGSGFAGNFDYRPAVRGRPAPPKSPFDGKSTAEDVTTGLGLDGMTALVTGCNSGIGHETLRVLAMRGAHVFAAARTREKAEKACASVDGRTTPVVIELTEFETVVNAAKKVRASADHLDMLILNAGIMALPALERVDGIEKQFVVNHLGHFLLTDRLRDLVVAAPQGRVVVVSSSAHVWAPPEGIQFDNLSGEAGYDPFAAYGQSKLANGLFSRELARRLADTRATSNSLHPGVIPTNLNRHLPQRDDGEDGGPPNFRMKTIPQGAATSCYVAAHPALREVTGYYFADCNAAMPNEHMQDDAMAARLWRVSEELTAKYRG